MGQRAKDVVQVLAESYHAGDWDSISHILSSYRPLLMRIVSQRFDVRMQARLDPVDVVQETLLEVTRRLGDYLERRPMSFRAWLHQTACQRLQMARREHWRSQRRSVEREVPLGDGTLLRLEHGMHSPSPRDRLLELERVERIHRALDELPVIDRELIVMRNFDNLSNLEAAELLGLQPPAASKRYGRALMRLREVLRQEGSSAG